MSRGLLEQARAAGLELRAEGERLIIRGPREAEPVAKLLIEHKPEVMELLAWDAAADAVLDAMYRRVAAAFDVRPWPIPGKADEAAQAAIEDACRAKDLPALRRAAERYVAAAETFAGRLAEAVAAATEAR